MCKEKRHNRKYTEEFRILVVKEYLSGGISKGALCKKHSIPQIVTLSSWIRKFVGDDKNENSMKKAESPKLESEEITRLKRELKEAKLALYQERMRADSYDTMIDVAEEMFKIPIRKKAGTKQ
jgi:transposase